MKQNVGKTDKIVRIVLGVVMAFLYLSGTVTGTLGAVLIVLAAVFILTALLGFCPIYAIVGLSTCKK